MKPTNFAGLVRISYHLTWLERFVCITSGVSLTCAVIIAGGDMSYIGRSLPALGLLQLLWVLFTVLATDTQLVAGTSAFRDSLGHRNMPAAAGWLFVILLLIPPAAAVNIAFGLVTSGLAHDDVSAVHMLGITPFWWVASRGFYGIFLLVVSCLTRPWAEAKIIEPSIIPPQTAPVPIGRKRARRPSTSRAGRPKRQEVAMTLWREEQAERLYTQNNRITIRQLASQLAYTEPTTGRVYPCAVETAAGILRQLRSRGRGTEAEAA
jgi:hypothetical protein